MELPVAGHTAAVGPAPLFACHALGAGPRLPTAWPVRLTLLNEELVCLVSPRRPFALSFEKLRCSPFESSKGIYFALQIPSVFQALFLVNLFLVCPIFGLGPVRFSALPRVRFLGHPVSDFRTGVMRSAMSMSLV